MNFNVKDYIKIQDPRYRHVSSKLKDAELDVSVFVQELMNAKPEEGAKVKTGQKLPSFLNRPPSILK